MHHHLSPIPSSALPGVPTSAGSGHPISARSVHVWGSCSSHSHVVRGVCSEVRREVRRDFPLRKDAPADPYNSVELRPDNAPHHFAFVARPDSRARRRTRLPAPHGLRPVRRRTYSVPEVAVILGIGRSTAYALVQRGELAALRVGGRVVVARAEIDRLLGEDPAA